MVENSTPGICCLNCKKKILILSTSKKGLQINESKGKTSYLQYLQS